MADTIPDVPLLGVAYQDLYAATGITVGVDLIIQNKTSEPIRVQIASSAPAADSKDGVVVGPRGYITTGTGESGAWAFGEGLISVQSNT